MSCDTGPPRDGALGLPTCISMDEFAFGVLTTSYAVGGLFGSLRAGHLAAFRGRKGATTLAASVLVGGTVLSSAAPAFLLLLLGRFVSGLACGVFTVVTPLYLAETAPATMRGSVGVLNQLSVSFGIFVAVALAIPLEDGAGWRISPLVSAGLAVLQLVSAPLVIDSPVWLAHQDAVDPLFVGDEARAEASDPLLPSAKSERTFSVLDIARSSDPKIRRGLWIVLLAFAVQQTSGVRRIRRRRLTSSINASMFFSTRIIEPVLPASAALISLVITFSGFALTFAPVFLIERVGRRPLFAFSSVGMIVSSFVLNYALNSGAGVLSAVALFADVAFFSFGMGPIPCVEAAALICTDASDSSSSATSCPRMLQARPAVSVLRSSASTHFVARLTVRQLATDYRGRRPLRADAASPWRRQRLLGLCDLDCRPDRGDPRAVQRLTSDV